MDPLAGLIEAIGLIPHGWALIGVCAAALLVQIAAVIVTRTRGRWAVVAAIVSTGALAALVILLAMSVHAGRASMLSAFAGLAGATPAENATALSPAISAQLNALPLPVSALAAVVMLWLVGLNNLAGRQPASVAARVTRTSLLVAPGMAPVVVGVELWTMRMLKGFAAVGGLSPEEKTIAMMDTLDGARGVLASSVGIARWAIVALTAIAVGLALRGARGRTAVAAPTSSSLNRRATLAALSTLVVAATLFVLTRPWRLENRVPWPPPLRGEVLRVVDPRTPDITGPDMIERAPVVMVFTDKIALDGYQRSLDDVEGLLGNLKAQFGVDHPGDEFAHSAVLVADARLSIEQLLPVLRLLQRTGYIRPLFTFTKAEVVERPLLGRLEHVRGSGVRCVLTGAPDVEAAPDDGTGATAVDGVRVRAADFPTYDALARRLVEVRRGGRAVVVNLGQ
jgi:hypothetical protein